MNNVILFVDTSEATASFIDDYTKMVLNIIEGLKHTSSKTVISLVLFNERSEFLCLNKEAKDCDFLVKLVPNGKTMLCETLVPTINKLKKFTDKIECKNPIMIIVSSGNDTSDLYKRRLAYLQLNMAHAYGWKFVFVGIDREAVEIGKQIGCNVNILYDRAFHNSFNIGSLLAEIVQEHARINADINVADLVGEFEKMKI